MPLNPESLHDRLKSASISYRWSIGGRWMIAGAAISLATLFLFLIGDMMFHFGSMARWLALILIMSSLLAGVALALPRFFKKISDDGIARRIERSSSGSCNVLINAVQFDRELPADSPLRAALFHEMSDPFPSVHWSDVFELHLIKKLLLFFLVAGVLLALWGVFQPAYFLNSTARIFLPSSRIEPLTRTKIAEIKPGNTAVSNGNKVSLIVKLSGEIPQISHVHFRESGEGWQKVILDHTLGTSEFDYVWKDVHQPIEYYVEAGDVQSDVYRIQVQPRTLINSKTAEVTPPAYTHLSKTSLHDFVMLENIPPGSMLKLSLQFNNEVTDLKVTDDKGVAFPVTRSDESHWTMNGTIASSQSLLINYTDQSGMTDSEKVLVSVKADEPPKLVILKPTQGSQILATRSDSFSIQFLAGDDYGLASLALYKSSGDKLDAKLVKEWKGCIGQRSFQDQATINLSDYTSPDDESVTFCLIAKDGNTVTGPGVTVSRPIAVQIKSSAMDVTKSINASQPPVHQGMDDIIKLQETNLEETRSAVISHADTQTAFPSLLTRQLKISEIAQKLADSPESIDPSIRNNLSSLLEKEMKDSVTALKNASNQKGDAGFLSGSQAIVFESAILARLRGASESVDNQIAKDAVMGLIGGVEELLRNQRELFKLTGTATHQNSKSLSDREDMLADQSQQIHNEIQKGAMNASLGDKDFRDHLLKASQQLVELKIYEDMLSAADKIQSEKFAEATGTQRTVLKNLASILTGLNQWQLSDAGNKIDEMKKTASDIKENLEALAVIQKEIIEKSKELARKTDFRPEDVAAAKEIAKSKELMAAAIEQMLKDGHIFPDVKQGNEMQTELTKVFEDVIQADKADSEAGKIKPSEIAVQKEEGILKAIEKATKIDEEQETFLPNSQNSTKWLLENFDKKEMPEMPMLTLPEQYEDLIGDLLETQKGLADKIEDAAANQLMAENPAPGNQMSDGVQDSFGAQGKSGNEKPKAKEEAGRSTGGREGMADGEMSGKKADNLEGSKPKVRRTSDAMQHGQVEDDGPPGVNLATGGGKSGGYSQQAGMDGDAPVKAVKAPPMAAMNAIAAQQALLAEKTSKQYAQASLLYLKTDGIAEVPRLMEESALSLKAGDMKNFARLHRQIVAKLQEAKGDLQTGTALIIPGNIPSSKSENVSGGSEGDAPAAYKKQVGDYYRSLTEDQ